MAEQTKYIVDFYEDESGDRPAESFISSCDEKMQAKIFRAVDILSDYGPMTKMPHSEYLTDGIFEIRAQSNGNIARVLYFFVVGKQIILTHGFVKKTQKTPSREIEKAKRYRDDYNRRCL